MKGTLKRLKLYILKNLFFYLLITAPSNYLVEHIKRYSIYNNFLHNKERNPGKKSVILMLQKPNTLLHNKK